MTASLLFEPIKKSHSIAEFIVFFESFDRLFSSNADAHDAKEAVGKHFSRVDEAPNVEITLDANGAMTEQRRDGYSFVKFREGTEELSWALRMSGNHISIHSLDYTRWDAIFPQILNYLNVAFSAIKKPLPLVGLGVKVVDRFKFVGSSHDEYRVDALFDPSSKFLTPHAFMSSQRWHVNTGWFGEPPSRDANEELLHQLNVDSSVFSDEDGKFTTLIAIDHSATLGDVGRVLGKPLSRFSHLEEGFDKNLSDALNYMHLQNKVIVHDLLNKSLASKMNLVLEKG